MAENVELEHEIKTLVIDEHMPGAIEALKAEGWEMIPNIPAVAVYHLVRQKNKPLPVGDMQLQMHIDESKIGILRNGKIIG